VAAELFIVVIVVIVVIFCRWRFFPAG